MQDSGANWTTIGIILLVVIGCVLVVFLGYMVRSAYELRIGLKAQLDKGLRSVEEDGAKKARAMRQELGAEIDRARGAIFEDGRRRLTDALATMEKRQADFESTVRQERIEMSVTADILRDEIAALTKRIEDLERELLVGGKTDDQAPTVTPLRPASGSITGGSVVAPLRFSAPSVTAPRAASASVAVK